MEDIDRRFLRALLDEVDAALEAGNVAEAILAAQDVRDYVNHEGPGAHQRCGACDHRFAEGIATTTPSPDMPHVCTDCREIADASPLL